jgi:cobaltochelatase CobN
MVERLLEAAERGLWREPDASTLTRLSELYQANDAWLEGRA